MLELAEKPDTQPKGALTGSVTQAVDWINANFASLDLAARLTAVSRYFSAPVFTTSLGKEDQVITSAIDGAGNIRVVTLQTGRLFLETLQLLEETRQRYGIDIEEYHPDQDRLAEYAERYGLNGFYDSVEARHACCHIRKLVPLKMALAGADCWITGIRREQSVNRAEQPFAEWDKANNLVKVNVLTDWSGEALEAHVAAHDVPVNPLHQRGFPSIGCEPCTRAIKPGEDERAGRWWWENDEKRECGLHVAQEQS